MRRLLTSLLLALGVCVTVAAPTLGAPTAAPPATPVGAPAQVRAAAPATGIPPTLRVGTEGVYPPFSYESGGQLTGFDIDVMNAIGARLGVQVEYVETPFDSMFAALQADRFDVVANQITFTPERDAIYDLSDPYVETTGVLVVAEDDDEVKGLADIRGLRAAENLTSNWSDVARENGAEVVGVDALAQAVDALRQGRVDVIVNDELAIRNFLATQPDSGVKVVAKTDDVSRSVLAARKGSGYLPQLNQAIADLRADGTLTKIYNKYFSADVEPPSTWDTVREAAWPLLKATVKTTIPLTVISFVIGLVIALAVGLMRMSTLPVVSGIARFYISLIRGTPLLVQLFIIFYALPELGIKVDPFPAAVIAFSLNVGGYAAEIIRGSIQGLPRGQWEAASTVGMDYATSLRRVILPQAARTAVPPLSNTLISLVKDTSLASAILVLDLFQQARVIAAPTFEYFLIFSLAGLYYWVVCLVLSVVQDRTEARLSRYVAA